MRRRFSGLMIAALALAVVFGASSKADAALITGQIDIGPAVGGGVQATGGTAWATATGLHFVTGITGFEGQVTGATDDFLPFLGSNVDLNDFTFNPFPAGGVTPLWTLSPSGATFDLLALTSVTQTNTSIDIQGTGIFTFPGFDPTPGTFEFTSQTAGGRGPTFSFSATQVAVPEPASVLLLGLGLLGSAGAMRRRNKK